MSLIDDLANIFTLQSGKLYLKTRESSTVEFKESFSRAGLVEYVKDLAAFANNSGGYLVFGIQNRPHTPIGLRNEQFDNTDESDITMVVNGHFAPTIEWSKHTHTWDGKTFGIIYVHKSNDKPVMAINNGGRSQEIKSGEIYYRYAARTENIHYAELKQLMDEKVLRERNMWLSLLGKLAKIGPENAAILDTSDGKIESGNRTILIDDELVSKLKFIREGQFDEKKGAITLRLVGDMSPVSVAGIKQQIVHDDPYKLKPSNVADQVETTIHRTFRQSPEHVKCWKYYKARGTYEEGKAKCNPKYCDYKEAINYFMYTQEWVDFLIEELSDPQKYREVLSTNIK